MRLIDAEKLQIKHFVQRGDQPIGYEGTQPVYDYTDLIAYDVDNAPTVKAIPIEWLEMFMQRYKIEGGNEYKLLHFMVTEWKKWEKENESDASN